MISSGFFVMLDPADDIACPGCGRPMGFCLLIQQIDVIAAAGVADLVPSLPGVSCERGMLPMMSSERKRTSLKVVIAKIDDAIRELQGIDYVGDKWALIADLQRVRNDLDTELEVTP